nr:hypothetical protein [Tanacetum cinerariifolium]
ENDEHVSEEDHDEHDSDNENDDQKNDSERTESDDDGDDLFTQTCPHTKQKIMKKKKKKRKRDVEMADAQINQEAEEVHVTLTTEPPVVQQQSSSVSSDLVSKFINPSLDKGDKVVARSSNQPQTFYATAASLSEFESKKILIDKIKENKSMNRSDRGRDDQDKDKEPSSRSNQGTKRRRSGKEESSKEATQQESKSTSSSKGESLSKKYTTSITKTKDADYGHVKWIEDKVPRSIWSPTQVVYDSMPTGEHITGDQNVRDSMNMLPTWKRLKMSIQNTGSLMLPVSRSWSSLVINIWKRLLFEDRKISYTSFEKIGYIVIQERVEDLQLTVERYQKKINLSKPDTYHSDLKKMIPYTTYRDIQGIIYQDDMDKNRLMRTDELHKFSDGTLNHVRTTLNDIANGIQMEYLPKRK